MAEYSDEDVGNIVLFEHVNVQVPDQQLATLFYIVGLGFTRDPYLNVGLRNMWANVGEQQFHLPTRPAQTIPGHIGIVVPNLQALQERLASVEQGLHGTQFRWSPENDHVAVVCPWGNRFHCYAPGSAFGDMVLGVPYVEFLTAPKTAKGIARFYDQVLGAPAALEPGDTGAAARVKIGRNQWLVFRETDEALKPYDGHHIAIYVANFSRPYAFLKQQGLIAEEVENHQFRFQRLIDPEEGNPVFLLEHEVRSLRHRMFHRPFVNRDPAQSQAAYRRGRDALVPYGE